MTGRLRFGALGNPHRREQREPVLSGRTNFAGPPNRGVAPDCRRRAQVAMLLTKLCGDPGV